MLLSAFLACVPDKTDADTAIVPPVEAPCGTGRVWCNDGGASGLWLEGPAYGRGASAIDVDDDGWEDIWQSDGGQGWPGYASASRLWHNEGDGTFSLMEHGIPPEHLVFNWSGVWADIDSDGDQDVLLLNGGYSEPQYLRLYRNDLAESGAFTDITAGSGLPPDYRAWWGASFADYDGDGILDIVINATSKVISSDEDLIAVTFLGRGVGDGTFVDTTVEANIPAAVGDMKNPLWFDYDGDGDQDLWLSAHEKRQGNPRLLRNDASIFTDVSASAIPGGDQLQPVFSAWASDFDQDGDLDLYLGRWFDQDFVAQNEGDGTFVLVGPEAGIDDRVEDQETAIEPVENTMGLTVGDLHGDGWPDVVIGTGDPDSVGDAIVFCNRAAGLAFERCSADFADELVATRHHGGTIADFDHDGDPDFFWNLGGHPGYGEDVHPASEFPALFRTWPTWVTNTATVKLGGAWGNTNAFGAQFEVRGDKGSVHHYVVNSTQGFQSQVSAWQTVALEDSQAGTVVVTWPNGEVTEAAIAAGERLLIEE